MPFMKSIIGIDPGKKGAFAHCTKDGEINLYNMPDTDGDIADLIRSLTIDCEHVYLEQVGGYVGGNGQPGSLMFIFGRNYGFLLGCLHTLGIATTLVTPQKWQVGIVTAGLKEKPERKRRIKEFVQREYPMTNRRITLDTSDALGILHYGLNKKENK